MVFAQKNFVQKKDYNFLQSYTYISFNHFKISNKNYYNKNYYKKFFT